MTQDVILAHSAVRTWWANSEAKVLHDEIGNFIARKPYAMLVEHQPETGEYIARIKFRPTHPLWNVRISSIIHHFRASLDNAIWELVILGGGTPRIDQHSFPITNRRDVFDGTLKGVRNSGLKRIEGVIEPVQTIVDGFQPYHAREQGLDYTRHPFWVLRELSDIDKHSALHLTLMAARVREKVDISHPDWIEIVGFDPITNRRWLVDGAEMFTFRSSRPVSKGDVEMRSEFEFRVVFDQATVSQLPAVGGLNIMTVLKQIDEEAKALLMSLRAVSQIANG